MIIPQRAGSGRLLVQKIFDPDARFRAPPIPRVSTAEDYFGVSGTATSGGGHAFNHHIITFSIRALTSDG